MADRIICQHDPLKPRCSMVIESGIIGRRIRCRACDVAAIANSDGTFRCSPYRSFEYTAESEEVARDR